MKRIGRGWQYDVFDLGNGRVLKKPYAVIERYIRILAQSGWSPKTALQEMKRVDRDDRQAREFILSHQIDLALLGNPKFNPDGSYEQDKLMVFGKVWKNASHERRKAMLEAYARLIHSTWQNGFADKVFKFSINNGFDAEGNIIQIDFGELALSKQEVARDILDQRWLKTGSCRRLEPEMRDFYKEIMGREMTLEKLDTHWRGI